MSFVSSRKKEEAVFKSSHGLDGLANAKKASFQPEKKDHWLSSDLRVKMVDRSYKRGRYYNTKVRRPRRGGGDRWVDASISRMFLLIRDTSIIILGHFYIV